MGPAPMRNDSRTTSTKADEFRRLEVITGVGRRRRWTDEEKAWIVAESLDPATTISAVARRYGLHPSQLFVWRQQLAASAVRDAPGVVPVLVAGDGTAPAQPQGRVGIALGAAGGGGGAGGGGAWAVRDAPGFVPVLVTEDGTAPAEPQGRIEIALGAAVVRVGADVDAAALRRVLEVVRGLA